MLLNIVKLSKICNAVTIMLYQCNGMVKNFQIQIQIQNR